MLLPVLHADVSGPFLTAWTFEPVPAVGLVLAAGGYGLALRRVRRTSRRPPAWYAYAYYAGLLSIFLALMGPLDAFNNESLFLHMLQHLILLQIAAPLILLGQPVQLVLRAVSPQRSGTILRPLLRRRGVRWALSVMTHPSVTFSLFSGFLIFWHVPRLYDLAVTNDTIHNLEHLSFLTTALLYWWPIIEPVPRHHKLRLGWSLASIFLTSLFGEALGAILTLAGHVIYPVYLSTPHLWGLSPLDDQELAGLAMWVGGGLLYMAILLGMLINALSHDDEPADLPLPSEVG